MKRRLALKLHGWAYQLAPEIAIAVRAAIVQQLAAEHHASQQAVASRRLEEHRQIAARAAQNN